jgi:hypothetical protein
MTAFTPVVIAVERKKGPADPIAVTTNAVVANWVVLVPGLAVGAVGVPVKAGDARGAYASVFINSVVATLIELSEVTMVGAVNDPTKLPLTPVRVPESVRYT